MNKKQDPMLPMRESLQILRYKQTENEEVEKYCSCCRVIQSCPTLCSSMDCSMTDFPVHPHLQEIAQTPVLWVSDAIQTSHPLSFPSPPAFNFSHHQGIFKCQFFTSGGQSTEVSASASVLPMNIQDWFPLGWTSSISFQFKGLSRVFSSNTIWKHQFLGT